MQITTISRGSFQKGKELAESLASNLGHECIGREMLIEAAIKNGIPIGKIESAIVKTRHLDERLLLIKEHYQAFATAFICERVLESNVVYHGRAGYLLLPGVRNILRVKVVENNEQRIHSIMKRMKLPYNKAARYMEDVNEDIHSWVKTLYGVDWNDYSLYDLTLNFDTMTTRNAATALCSVVTLPEFQSVPATKVVLENLRLSSLARMALATDKHTANASFRVDCLNNVVTVTYRPVDAQISERIPDIVGQIDGIKGVNTTMAASHILWIQEDFTNAQDTYEQIVDIAHRWNAAVELVRYNPELDADPADATETDVTNQAHGEALPPDGYNGGIEDDIPEHAEPPKDDSGLSKTYIMLAKDGLAGGHFECGGDPKCLFNTLDGNIKYNLVAVGDVFTTKGHAAKVRMKRELIASLNEKLRTPVIEAEELKKTYMFSFNQAVQFAIFLVIAVAIFATVFTHQAAVLNFIRPSSLSGKVMAAAFVVVLVPVFAFLYGNVAKTMLKLVKIE